jgi:hypothetical protein
MHLQLCRKAAAVCIAAGMSHPGKSTLYTKDRANNGSCEQLIFCSLLKFLLHADVKERQGSHNYHVSSIPLVNGGPDRTRTYDPRLIKAVL